MALSSNGEITELKSRGGSTDKFADAEDISGEVETPIGNVSKLTLYLETAGAVNIAVEFSPNGGTDWYSAVGESPLEYGSATTDIVEIGYSADRLRLTGSNGTAVTAEIHEVV